MNKSGPSSDTRFTFSEDVESNSNDDASSSKVHPSDKHDDCGISPGMEPEGFAGPKIVQPLTPEALAKFNAAQARTGVIYISRIPPGMRPAKVRHLMGAHGEVARVYLQQEDAKRAYLRRKYTSTKKPHFTEGWVEFKDKKVARSVAEMLNAQPIGGKKGTRWRDDVWTMKYLPKFKWNMLTEQISHEAAIHTAKLRVELAQSKTEQRDYLKNVELARVLDKRNEKRKEKGLGPLELKRPLATEGSKEEEPRKRLKYTDDTQLDSVLGSIF
ncbi:hypothetical protein EV702DRAFT_1082767 [Suillus placidus]|uniref:18S rRNA factor 2 n=1 Tax=Suillus placidus TaxID=48579 RepID=A0A9P7D6J1_9AGAM|nr:hypothetical protein EV702DRAFT_1082767 [Suillus placidus]